MDGWIWMDSREMCRQMGGKKRKEERNGIISITPV